MRLCPFYGCAKVLPDDRFACGRHWHSLSAEDKRRIWAAFDSYMSDEIGLDTLREIQQHVLGDRGQAAVEVPDAGR